MNQVEHNVRVLYVRRALLDLIRCFTLRDTIFLARAVHSRVFCQVDSMPAWWRWIVLRNELTCLYRIDG
jgi:hypothetical protein